VLLAFHPSQVQSSQASGAKLPLTIYESVYEGENVGDGDKSMQIDGEDQSLNIRFRELPYSIETGEAEMISVDYVARGGGNATAVEAPTAAPAPAPQSQAGKKKKGAKHAAEAEPKPVETTSPLSPEDEDRKSPYDELRKKRTLIDFLIVIANLTTRLNAVKTLESRIRLIKAYLSSLPPSFLNSSSSNNNNNPSESTTTPSTTTTPRLSYPILRNIASLIAHLSLLAPQDQEAFAIESLAQSNDVALVSLLGALGRNVQGMRELGRKAAIVETARQNLASRKTQLALQGRMVDEEYGGVVAPGGAMYIS